MSNFTIQVWAKKFKKFLPYDSWYINGRGELFLEDSMTGELIHEPPENYTISIKINDEKEDF
jgi:hypothetical protein